MRKEGEIKNPRPHIEFYENHQMNQERAIRERRRNSKILVIIAKLIKNHVVNPGSGT